MSDQPVPEQVVALLTGSPAPGVEEQALPFLTVDEAGFPHVALLSRAEARADARRVVVAVASRRTRGNLLRTGRATLIGVAGDTAHYLKLEVVRTLEVDGLLGCDLRPVEHVADSAGMPLSPIGYRPTQALAEAESWQATAALLDRLAAD
jgi:hypothetical protein